MKVYKKVRYRSACWANAALKLLRICYLTFCCLEKKIKNRNFTLTDYYNSLHFLDLIVEKCMDKVETSTCKWRVQNGHACSLGYMKYECFKTCVCGMLYFSQILNCNNTVANNWQLLNEAE